MRTPIEKGFGSIGTPCAWSASNVSRAECPMARMSCVQEVRAAPCASRHLYTRQRAVFDNEALKLRGEADLSAAGNDVGADALDNVDEDVRADMGLGIVQHALRRAVRVKLPQDPEKARASCVPVFSFPSEKGARAALAELHVALRIQRAAGAERVHGGLAGETRRGRAR